MCCMRPEYAVDQMKRIGLDNVCNSAGRRKHPLVYGEWLKASGKPTLLIYGHYDVPACRSSRVVEYATF